MILQVQDVTKRFGGLQALSDVTFDLPEGQILGLIGPNGAGKTTLFNVINGVYAPNSGRVIFRGEDITGGPPTKSFRAEMVINFLNNLFGGLGNLLSVPLAGPVLGILGTIFWYLLGLGITPYKVARRGIARAHQVVRPLHDLTVRENVMVGACFGRERLSLSQAARKADEALTKVGLIDRADQPSGNLNVAQKKRLELARALAANPYLLLLDEVLAGLNPSEIASMMETIRNIRDEGFTILMIEHVMQAVMSISDRILVLDYGVLIASGSPEEVANNPLVIEAYLGDPDMTARLMAE
ncbi:MAG: ABC transporter ATP-binding protein [Thermodesulfobacteriota bacterium]